MTVAGDSTHSTLHMLSVKEFPSKYTDSVILFYTLGYSCTAMMCNTETEYLRLKTDPKLKNRKSKPTSSNCIITIIIINTESER